jgi:UDPglucose--hexose-1-phosphate uridylyltransferase
MFTVTEILTGTHNLQLREEILTGQRCKISPERLNRRLDAVFCPPPPPDNCPFCPGMIRSVTPTFSDGKRICIGESVTFPNLFPFAECHTVTVVTRDHYREEFSKSEIRDALLGQIASLARASGYRSINWNYLPSAGASIAHPHLQGMADRRPPAIAEKYLSAGSAYELRTGRSYWEDLKDHERKTPRYMFGDELFWYAHFVPLGEREVRCILPISCMEEFDSFIDDFTADLLSMIRFYRSLGTHAFNLSVFFDREKSSHFSAFCSMISRINPNASSTSDTAFMERLHLEPVILTLPEEVGRSFRLNGCDTAGTD